MAYRLTGVKEALATRYWDHDVKDSRTGLLSRRQHRISLRRQSSYDADRQTRVDAQFLSDRGK
jgi:hypothetical protein